MRTLNERTDDTNRWARRTASEVKDLWRNGELPDLARVLDTYPGLKQHTTIVVDLAYEEVRLRQRAGESLDVAEYARRFHTFERAITCYLLVRSFSDKDSLSAAIQCDLSWPEAGSQFLGFNMVHEIGRGAVGRVFLATEDALGGRRVAVKVTAEGGHEANILGRLDHASIVPIHSIQTEASGTLTAICMPFFGKATLAGVMDHVYADGRTPLRASSILTAIEDLNEGEDISCSPRSSDGIHRSGSYVEGVVRLGVQLAEALAHAHSQGIYHRDLKPQNILLAPDGRPLLLDFNLSVDNSAPMWRIGGTLPYMAPEVLRTVCKSRLAELHYDPRSDLFSLGTVLYELLEGRLPFGEVAFGSDVRKTTARLRKRQTKGPRKLRNLNRRVDARLADLVQSCLAFDPKDRPASANDLASALRKELSVSRRINRLVAAHRRKAMAAVAAILLAVVGISAYFALRPPYPVRQFRRALDYCEAGSYDLALQCLNDAVAADPRNVDVLMARARIFKRQGNFELAFVDYDAADHIASSPVLLACKGYCSSRLGFNQPAVLLYNRAIDGGCDSPAVFNDLGYTWLRLDRLDDAERCLLKAVQADDAMQAAHHNLVLVYVHKAMAGTSIPDAAFVHARRALDIGPESGELYRDLAKFYAVASKQDRARVQLSIDCVTKAVAYGIDWRSIDADFSFLGMKDNPAFRDALARRRSDQGAVNAEHLVDPIGSVQ